MKQVFLSGSGQVSVEDVPLPGRMRGTILVRNHASLISSGTEGAAVTRHGGLRGLIEKATSSADRIEQVWRLARSQGLRQTADMVRSRIEDLTPIGYSCAGEVVEVSDLTLGFKPGDRVAGMGTGFANHADYVVLPKNLAVVLPPQVSSEEAAFGAVACIALQGLRRLDLGAGSRIGVIGLGLIGQLAMRLLSATGAQAFGIDADPRRAAMAAAVPGALAWALGETDSRRHVQDLTGGHGLDGVIIAAGSKSSEPVNLAFDLCRVRGRIAVIGDVGLDLDRAKMYRKELELRLSCSYGPGRYDDDYELGGRDYPIGHVRWTERRNLEYVVALLAQKRLAVADLISARFPVSEAAAAYARLKQGTSETIGILLDYDRAEPVARWPQPSAPAAPAPIRIKDRPIRVGLIGLGGFAKAVHLPNLRKLPDMFRIEGVAARSANSIAAAAKRAGIAKVATDHAELLGDPAIDAVIISTRHASHGGLVHAALAAGKHVFVEKPMAITTDEARSIVELAASSGLIVRVGFNRRFAPYLGALREVVGRKGRRILSIRVSIGDVHGHWSNTAEEGGRLMGEGVHFFDLCNWFFAAEPEWMSAGILGEPGDVRSTDTAATIGYPDGGIAQLLYTTLGAPTLGKESFEAHGNGASAVCHDFQQFRASKPPETSLRGRRGDKGHLGELREFAAAIRGDSFPIEGADARAGLLATAMAEAARAAAAERTVIDCREWTRDLPRATGQGPESER